MAQAHEHRLTRLLMRAETLVYAGCYSIYTLTRLKKLRQCVYHIRSEIRAETIFWARWGLRESSSQDKFQDILRKMRNKLGLSCAKLR